MKKNILLIVLLVALNVKSQDTLRHTVYFKFDEYTIHHSAEKQLQQFTHQIQQLVYNGAAVQQIILTGRADSKGSIVYNDWLSQKRVQHIRQYPGLLELDAQPNALAHGKRKPLNADITAIERQLNRSVQIMVIVQQPKSPKPQLPAVDTVVQQETVPVNATPKQFTKENLEQAKEGDRLILKNINFYGGRHIMLPNAYEPANELLLIMQQNPGLVIEIQGHICCGDGTLKDGTDNDTGIENLSFARAKAIYDWLLERGVPAHRMSYRGFGNSVPLVKEYTEADKTTNRRVEIKIVKRG
jgi:outer membrane protein OmpA-like peptidoglycan-associated protein